MGRSDSTGALDPRVPRLTRQPYGPQPSIGMPNFEILERVEQHKKYIRAAGKAFMEARDFKPVLVEYLAKQLFQYEQMFIPQYYGDDNVTIPAGQYLDIPLTVDPRAYFAGSQFLWRNKVEAAPNVTVQLIESAGYNLFGNPVNCVCLNNNPEHTFFYDFPRDWILSPGENFTIRLHERTGQDTLCDCYIGGMKIFYKPQPEVRLPFVYPAGTPSPEAGMRDHIVTSATGQTFRVPSRGAAFPGSEQVIQSVFPGLKLISTEPNSVFDFIREETDRDFIGAMVEAYRNTYRPAAYGQDDVVVAGPVGNTGRYNIPTASDSYFVATQLGIALNAGTKDWSVLIMRAAGAERLSNEPINFGCFQLAGSGVAAGELGGSWYPLPQPWVIPPKEEIILEFTNNAGVGFECDFHLLGYKVFCV